MRYLLIDRVRAYEAGKRLVAVKNVTLEAPYFADHFPGQPIFPGAFHIEAMAQASGCLIERSLWELEGRRVLPLLHGVTRARFLRLIRPGDQLLLEVVPRSLEPQLAATRVTTAVEGKVMARAELAFLLIDPRSDPRYAHLIERQDALWELLRPAGDRP
jgi:3-hydroxyacyl-[acyl-carrier-protein] dehydratase